MNSTIILANWLFVMGSTLFTLDAVMEISRSLSVHSVFLILASLAFTFGCVLFLEDACRQRNHSDEATHPPNN
ncbi:MAG: hypothetical protein QNJ53_13815 [Pleurocapsa sp. MO_192.B19]|nr:hypothetical protein [Pleurocapsa sp. MO_192.B19]